MQTANVISYPPYSVVSFQVMINDHNLNFLNMQFLPHDSSYAKRGICRRRVSVSVCVCVSVCHTPVLYQNG